MIRETARKVILSLLHRAGYDLIRIDALKDRERDITDEEWKIYTAVKSLTMVSASRIVANIRSVDYVLRSQIPGDVVECGVWRGGSSMAIALRLIQHGDTSRKLWMYDTFSGMTDATAADVSYAGLTGTALLASAKRYEGPDRGRALGYASLHEVQANMRETGYPMNQIEYVKGPVEETLPANMPDQISLLRIDTDWYSSTKHELMHLYPRLSVGGILIIDDYGHWHGARKAVDEYFSDTPVFLNRIDYTGRLVIKPAEHIQKRLTHSDTVEG